MSEFRRKIMMASGGGAEPTPLAWIESDGTQMMILPVTTTTLTKIFVYVDSATLTTVQGNEALFGSAVSSNQSLYYYFTKSGTSTYAYLYNKNRTGGSYAVYSTYAGKSFGVTFGSGYLDMYVGGSRQKRNSVTLPTTSYPIGLFGRYTGTSSWDYQAKQRITKVECSDSNGNNYTLLPYKDAKGKVGLYDADRDVWYYDVKNGNPFTYSL